jgi:hypothetical protein
VKAIADPQGRGRQYLATFLSGLAGTHAAGFVLIRQHPAGKWTAATYVLTQAAPTDTTGHRTHRTDGPNGAAAPSPVGLMDPMPAPTDSTGHRTHRTDGPNGAAAPSPVGPMGPMPDATGNDVPPGEEAAI